HSWPTRDLWWGSRSQQRSGAALLQRRRSARQRGVVLVDQRLPLQANDDGPAECEEPGYLAKPGIHDSGEADRDEPEAREEEHHVELLHRVDLLLHRGELAGRKARLQGTARAIRIGRLRGGLVRIHVRASGWRCALPSPVYGFFVP